MGRTDGLVAPRNPKDFTKDWAERIMVDYKMKYDSLFLKTPGVLRVLDVIAKENPNPGMLSNSYLVQVSYKLGDKGFHVESWFVKIPKSPSTATMDSVEAFMYSKMFPLMQGFINENYGGIDFKLPVPKAYFCAFDENFEKGRNMCVIEDLRGRNFKPLESKVCGVAYMRSTMRCLAQFHSAAVALQHHIGGRGNFLLNYPLIVEKELPKMKLIKRLFEQRLMAYILYLFQIHPDLKHQLMMLAKFEKHLFKVFKAIYKDEALRNLQILIHGDSKMDNFLFKKDTWSEEEQYSARLIDWQGVCFDILSSDLVWTLYGFMKNLPDKNSQVDSFLDYSVAFYHEELVKHLRCFGLRPEEVGLPGDDYDAVCLIKKGFVLEFLKVAVLNPIISIRNPDLLLEWFQDRDNKPVPSPEQLFKGGQSYLSFVHLQFTIATEIGVFHDLAPLCFTALKESMFAGFGPKTDSDDEDDEDDEGKGEIRRPNGSGNQSNAHTGGQNGVGKQDTCTGTSGTSGSPYGSSGAANHDSKPGFYASMSLDLAQIRMPDRFNKRAAEDPFNYRYKRRFFGKDQSSDKAVKKVQATRMYPVLITEHKLPHPQRLEFVFKLEVQAIKVEAVTLKTQKRSKAPNKAKAKANVTHSKPMGNMGFVHEEEEGDTPEGEEDVAGIPIQIIGERVAKRIEKPVKAPIAFPDILDDAFEDESVNLEINQGQPGTTKERKISSLDFIGGVPQACQDLFQSEEEPDVSLMSTSADPSSEVGSVGLPRKLSGVTLPGQSATFFSRQTTLEDDMSITLDHEEDECGLLANHLSSQLLIEDFQTTSTTIHEILDNHGSYQSTDFPDVLDSSDEELEVVHSTIYIKASG
ncbi:hypothetical protein TCAL_04551 [Tigriopus californicus]|uniref:CHK kinase-like domain-containing protein n=1 Tax=Tigriopus californicus TaxID=6832 RepID=A0A553PSA8_TIGCA|nr:hypothetical protein TCAL_04551 [Tigriopus californicus]